MGQYKPMPKMFTTEPSVELKLKKGGRAHFVTKQPEWFIEQFEKYYDEVSVREIRGYFIVKGTHRGPYRERNRSSAD